MMVMSGDDKIVNVDSVNGSLNVYLSEAFNPPPHCRIFDLSVSGVDFENHHGPKDV